MGRIGLISQPLVVGLTVGFRIVYNGIPVLNANRII